VQVNNINAAALTDFSTRLAAAAAAPPGSSTSKLELRSAVHDAKYQSFAGPVNSISACPHHVRLHRTVPLVTSVCLPSAASSNGSSTMYLSAQPTAAQGMHWVGFVEDVLLFSQGLAVGLLQWHHVLQQEQDVAAVIWTTLWFDVVHCDAISSTAVDCCHCLVPCSASWLWPQGVTAPCVCWMCCAQSRCCCWSLLLGACWRLPGHLPGPVCLPLLQVCALSKHVLHMLLATRCWAVEVSLTCDHQVANKLPSRVVDSLCAARWLRFECCNMVLC
jgi:hypothetical protein